MNSNLIFDFKITNDALSIKRRHQIIIKIKLNIFAVLTIFQNDFQSSFSNLIVGKIDSIPSKNVSTF